LEKVELQAMKYFLKKYVLSTSDMNDKVETQNGIILLRTSHGINQIYSFGGLTFLGKARKESHCVFWLQ